MNGYTKLLLTTIAVGGRHDTAPAPAEEFYALLVSTCWEGDEPSDPTARDRTLLPWLWSTTPAPGEISWPGKEVVVYDVSVDPPTEITVGVSHVNAERTPPLAPTGADIVKGWFKLPLAENFELRRPDGTAPAKARVLYEQLGSLLRLPGPIAQVLSLASYFSMATPPARFVVLPRLADIRPVPAAPQPNALAQNVMLWEYRRGPDVVLLAEVQVVTRARAMSTLSPRQTGYWLATTLEETPLPHATSNDRGAQRQRDALLLRMRDDGIAVPDVPDDDWQDMAGIGVLLRRKQTDRSKGWRFVTAAWVDRRLSTSEALSPILSEPTLVPLPLDAHDRTPRYDKESVFERTATIDYDEGPLVAEPAYPLQGTTTADATSWNMPTRLPDYTVPDYKLRQVADRTFNRFRLPPLSYGEVYQAAIFAVDLAGGLPFALQGDFPWILKETECAPPGERVGELQFFRRIGIGHVDVVHWDPAKSERNTIEWPLVPPEVSPLTSALGLPRDGTTVPREGEDATERHSAGTRAVIVLKADGMLGKTNHPFVFALRPPATTLDVIKRWCKALSERRSVFENYFAQLGLSPADGGALDDPAVKGVLVVLELSDGSSWTRADAVVMHAASEKGRSKWTVLSVSVEPGAHGAIELSDGASHGKIVLPAPKETVRNGITTELPTLARVSVQSIVDPTEIRDRFATEAVTATDDIAVPKLSVMRAERFWIEVAPTARPTAETLFNATTLAINGEREVCLSLDPERPDPKRIAPLWVFDRIDIEREVWRYRGEPRPWDYRQPFPTNPSNDAVDQFETRAFDGRAEVDVVRVAAVPLDPRVALSQVQIVARDSFRTDAASRYARYRLRAYSRYAGLYPAHDTAIVGSLPLKIEAGKPRNPTTGDPERDPWLRALLEYSGAQLAAPVIRALIPLTSPAPDAAPLGTGGETPGALLALVDETPFVPGIAEEVEVEVVDEGNPQSGPDPTLDGVARHWPQKLIVDGPYGHTRDTDSRVPRFIAGSYIVRPPNDARAWDFAKLRARRVARMPWEGAARMDRASAWTAPQWVQVLPPHTFGTDRMEARLSNGALSLHLHRAGPVPPPSPTMASAERDSNGDTDDRFRYGVLITRQVFDHRRQPAEVFERFVLVEGDPADLSRRIRRSTGDVALTLAFNPPASGTRSVRLCELQLRTGYVLEADAGPLGLLGRLMPDGDEDVPMRLTRIGRPCPIQS